MFGQKSSCCCQSRASGEPGCGEVRHRWRNDRGWKSRDQGRHVPGVQEGERCWWVHIVPTVNYANYLSGSRGFSELWDDSLYLNYLYDVLLHRGIFDSIQNGMNFVKMLQNVLSQIMQILIDILSKSWRYKSFYTFFFKFFLISKVN